MRSGFLAYVVMLAAVLGGLSGPFGGRALAQTTVGGVIDRDTTWTLAGSPYTVEETVELIGGAVLTIEPGVEVAFEAGTALDSSLGVLIADGLGGDAIVLRSVSGEVGGWQGVVSSLDVPAVTTPDGEYVSGPIFRNVRLSEAVRGVDLGPAPIYFESVEIDRCAEAGIYTASYTFEPAMWLKGVTVREANIGLRFRGTLGDASRLVLHDCVFEGNIGGGMETTNSTRGEMLRCVFRGNGSSAPVGDEGVGGACLVGTWDIRACVFEGNEVNATRRGGGGLILEPDDATIADCDFLDNTCRGSGGGADIRQTVSQRGTIRVERCRFIGNTSSASSGAGMLIEVYGLQSEAFVDDCTFEGNDGELNGGLALIGVVRGEVTRNTFERNSGRQSAGGLRYRSGAYTGTVTIRDNAFIENTSEAIGGAIELVRDGMAGPRIESNLFRGNTADAGGAIGGIATFAPTEVVGNAFEGNSARLGGAVHVGTGAVPRASLAGEDELPNRFASNTADLGADIYNDTRDAIDATGNCWGTDDLTAIAGRIYDASDDPTKGAVAFDPVATECGCPADLDADGELTIFDFLAFQNLFDLMDPAADFDGDGAFTIFDFLAFQNAFDAGC